MESKTELIKRRAILEDELYAIEEELINNYIELGSICKELSHLDMSIRQDQIDYTKDLIKFYHIARSSQIGLPIHIFYYFQFLLADAIILFLPILRSEHALHWCKRRTSSIRTTFIKTQFTPEGTEDLEKIKIDIGTIIKNRKQRNH